MVLFMLWGFPVPGKWRSVKFHTLRKLNKRKAQRRARCGRRRK